MNIARFISQSIKKIINSLIFRPILCLIKIKGDLLSIAQAEQESQFFRVSNSHLEKILGNEKIHVLDIGARGGPEKEIQKYKTIIDLLLVESDLAESERLKQQGHTVINSLIGKNVGQETLYVTKKGANCSFLEPGAPFLNFYTGGRKSDRFDVLKKIPMQVNTIANILDQEKKRIDYLKIDTQGTELQIIKGMGKYRPIILKVEINFVPLYNNSDIFWDIGKYLYDLGYLMFHNSFYTQKHPANASKNNFSNSGIPTTGDAWFCPDWTRKEGMEIISERQQVYEALMTMFSLRDIYEYSVSWKNNERDM